ncbi:plasmid mobilization protein [Microterricola pindariensis]|uniref:plasmid mobilization protein n=1 Tax=Microterricola pindariensis TaxID=478010 RepID=UPI0010571E6B|nr:hypothetical protein [Microterricola pindariensis]
MANPIADTRRPNRRRIVSVRLNEGELDRILRAAARDGIAPSVLMRAAALDAVNAARPSPSMAAAIDVAPQAPARELVELRTSVNRVGGNVNQLARLGNQSRALVITAADDEATVTELLSDLRALLVEVRTQLGGYR